ncbi:hypothetical protein DFP72DRAFT_875934, partial [Ephemerocybe angulata]
CGCAPRSSPTCDRSVKHRQTWLAQIYGVHWNSGRPTPLLQSPLLPLMCEKTCTSIKALDSNGNLQDKVGEPSASSGKLGALRRVPNPATSSAQPLCSSCTECLAPSTSTVDVSDDKVVETLNSPSGPVATAPSSSGPRPILCVPASVLGVTGSECTIDIPSPESYPLDNMETYQDASGKVKPPHNTWLIFRSLVRSNLPPDAVFLAEEIKKLRIQKKAKPAGAESTWKVKEEPTDDDRKALLVEDEDELDPGPSGEILQKKTTKATDMLCATSAIGSALWDHIKTGHPEVCKMFMERRAAVARAHKERYPNYTSHRKGKSKSPPDVETADNASKKRWRYVHEADSEPEEEEEEEEAPAEVTDRATKRIKTEPGEDSGALHAAGASTNHSSHTAGIPSYHPGGISSGATQPQYYYGTMMLPPQYSVCSYCLYWSSQPPYAQTPTQSQDVMDK